VAPKDLVLNSLTGETVVRDIDLKGEAVDR